MDAKTYIQALEIEQAGDWDRAHRIVQKIDTAEAAGIHAYQPRGAGDQGNAAYWYRRAGKPEFTAPLSTEWQQLFDALSQATRVL